MKARVLVVDSDLEMLNVVTDLLMSQYPEIELWTALNGEEAIQFLETYSADVVIMSTDLPATDGWEALYVIKDEDNWPSTPVVMVLSEGPDFWDDALKACTIGADHYVSRPVKSFELTSILDELLKETV